MIYTIGVVSVPCTPFQYLPLFPVLLLLHPTPRLLCIIPAPPTILQTQYHIFTTTTISLSSLSHYQSAHQLWIIHPKNAGPSGSRTQHLIFILYISVAIPFII
ncbi:hypothetical protein BYT27DRAFT_6843674 [Phlegmacium glaucopus]|nr:hypothetical protein BYT27DRAFT_6843674 [Phlegmacium glaucopus]